MLTIKATKTMRYAGLQPHLPTHRLVEGELYTSKDVPAHVIDRAVKAGFAKPVSSEDSKLETKVIEPESKEKGMKGKKFKK